MPNDWTLLIIDDCAADRKIYRRYLLKDPHQSYQGMALCLQKRCDLILLDFCLPNMSGLEFLDWLKEQRFETPIPVIMLTGRGDEEIAVQAMKKGVQDYLVKQNLQSDSLQIAVRNGIKQSYLQNLLEKTQERQRLIAMTALRIRQSLNLEQILNTAVTEVQQLLRCDRVVVYQYKGDRDGKIVASSLPIPPSEETQKQRNSNTQKVQGYTQLLESPPVPHLTYESSCCLKLVEQTDLSANQIVPIILCNEGKANLKPWGLLIAHQCSQKRHWQTTDREMLYEVSVQLAIAIQQAELLAQSQAALVKEKQLNAFKSQIISTISHEYRNPLASILAGASTLKQHSQQLDESKKEKLLQIIEHKARHLSKLVDDMLIYNQFELNKIEVKPIPLNLNQFFSDLIEEQRQITNTPHELIFKSLGNNQNFRADRGLLRIIFDNLMSNAIKYSPEGKNVEFHLIEGDAQVIFYIQDKGIGIPIKDQEHLFQPFSRASNVDIIPGTGLGLAIVKACVEIHGGNITLESQLGQGTKVTVRLPK
jgi:signal transduction histidine kinase/FixJ family two-component response regulator